MNFLRRPAVGAVLGPLALLLLAPVVSAARAQERAEEHGAAALGLLVQGLGVSARVLVIAAHPDDEDTQLITWLSKGRHVETAYLSLTRGDGGQNLIGNELGEGLGAIRTQELLAARRVDGGRQYFTRAYDFGFSKNAAETLTQWARDSILRDVVTVVRAFRPHVIVAVFSGTPADGHGHHQVSGMLARDAYDIASDTVRFPRAATAGHGPWTVSKLYRGARFRNQDKATIRMNVGEFDPLLGRSYAEIASESRSQHKSQAFGALQLKGVMFDQLLREATRVNAAQEAKGERSIFDGIDTTWGRFVPLMQARDERAALDSLSGAIRDVARTADLFRPASVIPVLARVHALAERLCGREDCPGEGGAAAMGREHADLERSLEVLQSRLHEALRLASGVALEATASREVWATGERVPVRLALYNRGTQPVRVLSLDVALGDAGMKKTPAGREGGEELAPDSVRRDSTVTALPERSEPWWLESPRRGAMFTVPVAGEEEQGRAVAAWGVATVVSGGVRFPVTVPVTYRFADPIRGEVNRPIAAAPAVTLLLDDEVTYARANVPIERTLRVHVRSHGTAARDVAVRLTLPAGLVADSVERRITFPASAPTGDATSTAPPGVMHTLTFNVRGRLAPGRHEIAVSATSGGERFASGYVEVSYEHIRTQRLFRPSTLGVEAVDVTVPRGATIAYIAGVGDNVAPTLEQLGVGVTMLAPEALPRTDLSRFTAVVVGTRAYEASEALVANNARLLDYAKRGGTLVVQYGQYEMTRPGIMPFPITLSRPATRVTVEGVPVRILDPSAPVLNAPNRLTTADFAGWVQDLSLYMPSTFDRAYRPVVELSDPGEPGNQGGILVAPLGKGTYVYTTLAFFRQLPNGVPGAARLFVNLLSARAVTVQP